VVSPITYYDAPSEVSCKKRRRRRRKEKKNTPNHTPTHPQITLGNKKKSHTNQPTNQPTPQKKKKKKRTWCTAQIWCAEKV
jgi:hypothetical protein